MSKFFNDTMQGLLEAIEIKKGSILLTERKEMTMSTFCVSNNDTELINQLVENQKNKSIS